MKTCPKCQNTYTDETLKFCLQDGTELVDSGIESDQTEAETVVSSKRAEQISFDLSDSREDVSDQSQVTQVSAAQNEPKSSKTLIAVLSTVLVMLVLFGIAGIAAFMYFNGGKEVVTKQNNPTNQVDDSEKEPKKNVDVKTPKPTTSTKPTAKKDKEPPPEIDKNPEQTKKDVEKTIFGWKDSAEAINLSSYMKNYASKVDYYKKKGASKSFVYKDKQNAFSKYNDMKSTLSNMQITSSKDGKSAVAEFDKEWIFTGEANSTNGKVRSQLKFRKVDGQWLIVSEKDLKVYYVNK